MDQPDARARTGALETFWLDVGAHVSPVGRSRRSHRLAALAKAVLQPQVHATLHHRLAHALHRRGLGPLAALVKVWSLRRTGAEIHPAATIGPGLCLVHSTGVVIGAGVVVGSGARIHQGVTLGVAGHGARDPWVDPVVGDGVTLGAHAVVLGAVTVGDGAVVGANSVVRSDVPAGATVGGVPARVIRPAG